MSAIEAAPPGDLNISPDIPVSGKEFNSLTALHPMSDSAILRRVLNQQYLGDLLFERFSSFLRCRDFPQHVIFFD